MAVVVASNEDVISSDGDFHGFSDVLESPLLAEYVVEEDEAQTSTSAKAMAEAEAPQPEAAPSTPTDCDVDNKLPLPLPTTDRKV